MAQRSFKQIPKQYPMYRTITNTVWIYPEADIQRALKTSTHVTSYDGTNIIVPSIADFIAFYSEMYIQTAQSQPIGNPGFTCGVGTLLQDFGKTLEMKLPSGEVIARFRLVKQISPQATPPIPNPGNSPNRTVGFVLIFAAYGTAPNLSPTEVDTMLVVRV